MMTRPYVIGPAFEHDFITTPSIKGIINITMRPGSPLALICGPEPCAPFCVPWRFLRYSFLCRSVTVAACVAVRLPRKTQKTPRNAKRRKWDKAVEIARLTIARQDKNINTLCELCGFVVIDSFLFKTEDRRSHPPAAK
jgi:hypothetical protein